MCCGTVVLCNFTYVCMHFHCMQEGQSQRYQVFGLYSVLAVVAVAVLVVVVLVLVFASIRTTCVCGRGERGVGRGEGEGESDRGGRGSDLDEKRD